MSTLDRYNENVEKVNKILPHLKPEWVMLFKLLMQIMFNQTVIVSFLAKAENRENDKNRMDI